MRCCSISFCLVTRDKRNPPKCKRSHFITRSSISFHCIQKINFILEYEGRHISKGEKHPCLENFAAICSNPQIWARKKFHYLCYWKEMPAYQLVIFYYEQSSIFLNQLHYLFLQLFLRNSFLALWIEMNYLYNKWSGFVLGK